ncbi:LysR family transcriptional regulator [uncultured Roseibium sp.]|uniref:LysR family transcriptional regulator n=1 Tax=uncultured Roseibium sp. TaxID=1936171 RepID=UPI00261ABEA4|nr:LysR family transcriptional regulator [uncultured Roseibium sp.]
MNIRHLAFVLSVAETGSFRSAADACNVTQPTLSAGIKQIEHQFGAKIFQRSTRSVAITEFGRQVLPAISDVVASEEALLAQVRQLLKPEVKLIRIGVSPIVEVPRIMDLFADYQQQYPGVEFVFKECFIDDLHDRLHSETLDLAILPETAIERKGIATSRLYKDPWVFLPSGAELDRFGDGAVSLRELESQTLILTSGHCGLSQATEAMFETEGLSLDLYPGRAISYAALENWADLGLGAALLPASKVSRLRQGPCLPILETDGRAAMLELFACWSATPREARHVARLVSLLENGTLDGS